MRATMRWFRWLPILLILPAAADQSHQTERPNILLIVAEDMSSRVGSFGDVVATTPAIDALAQEGVRFPHTFTAAGVCAPSRAALITGVHPQSMGAQHMRTSTLNYEAVPPLEIKAFPELLRRVGYATGNTVKTDYQFGKPFTVWDYDDAKPGAKPDLAVWRQLPDDKPFFAMITLLSTHERQLATATTKPFAPWVENLLKEVIAFRNQKIKAVTSAKDVIVPPYYPDTQSVRASITQLYDNIHYMDSEVRQVLENLHEDGLANKTIVIWTTDHGDGLPRAKRSVYDSGLQVPMIVRFPDGQGAGGVDQNLVSFVDLAPTILRLAGANVPDFIQGRNFLSDEVADRRKYIYASHDRMDNVPDKLRAVRDRRYKYIRNYEPETAFYRPLPFRDMFPIMQALWKGSDVGGLNRVQSSYFSAPRATEELYDTTADPYEIRNLAGEPGYAANLEGLRDAMDKWLIRIGDRSVLSEEDMIADMWPGGEQPVTAAPEASVVASSDNRMLVELQSATPGASIGYRFLPASNKNSWHLYVQALQVPDGTILEAKAIRYGYKESGVIRANGRRPAFDRSQ